MALRTKNGVAVLIPATSLKYLAASLWVAQVLTVPFVVVAALGVLAECRVLEPSLYSEVGSSLLGLAIVSWALGLMAIAYGVFLFMDIVAAEKGKLLQAVAASRFAFWTTCWAAGNFGCVLLSEVPIPNVWPFVLGAVWIASAFAFYRAIVHLRRTSKEARRVPLFGNLSSSELRSASKPDVKFGPGTDFPRASRNVTTVRAARAYSALAVKRQFVREQIGTMMRVVGGAFIGGVGLWAFSEDFEIRMFMFFGVVLVVFIGFAVERRHKFYETLSSEYSARAGFIAAARHRRSPRLRRPRALRRRREARPPSS